MSLRFVALSLQTSGPDPKRDRIQAISATTIDAQSPRSHYSARIAAAIADSGEDGHAADPPVSWSQAARELREFAADRIPVLHDAPRVLAVLGAEGFRLDQPPFDTAELASILVPGLAATDIGSVSEALGVGSVDGEGRGDADVVADVFAALLARIAEYDETTLDRLATHIYEGNWPFAQLFDERIVSAWRAPDGARLLPPEIAYLRERVREDPLEPTGSIEPVTESQLQRIIGPQGALAHVIPGFERRPQQEQMAAAVAETINSSGQILVEAGTGTGKSLAYLVPTALQAAERGEAVVLSTNTLALQDQLIRKDVPDLLSALAETDQDMTVGVVAVKGRANYLCLRRWFPWEREVSLDQDEARLKAKVLAWLPRTQTGDRAELRLTGGEESYWRRVAEEEGSCDPGSCVFHQRGQCFLFRARRAAAAAHLVVVNHALLLTDAVSSNSILPNYDTLVIDEAHHLEDQATNQFTVSLSERELIELADAVARRDEGVLAGVAAGAAAFLLGAVEDQAGQRLAREARERMESVLAATTSIRNAGRDLFAALEYVHLEAADGWGGPERSRRVTAATRAAPAWQAVESSWDRLLGALKETESELRWFITAVDAVDDVAASDLAEAGERQELLLSDLSTTLRACAETTTRFAGALDAPEPGRVFWLERLGPNERVVFKSAPLDVSGLLQDRLFKKTRATVLTSATLAVDGRCDYLASRLGIPDATALIVPSPFNYRASVLLYLADDMPEPTQPGYQEILEQTLIDAIDATRGRALVLFTSHSLLADVARSISGPLEDRGIVVLAQRRDGSPQQLTERLRRESNVAVLGTSSFWEGVDVAGEALSLLVITRLPFSVPSDPVFAARSEAFEDAFAGYAVPQAVLRFKQGFGRLIRSSQDRGVCAVLDRRILTKRYGVTFMQSLPDCSVEVASTLDLGDAARAWLATSGEERESERLHATSV